MNALRAPFRPFPRRQQGAVLFIAMMLLIILSLLAVSTAQVTGMQERMAGIYRSDHESFEHAEQRLRQTEKDIRGGQMVDPCSAALGDPTQGWLSGTGTGDQDHVENLNNAMNPDSRGFGQAGSLEFGQSRTAGDVTCLFFRVSSLDYDDPTTKTSSSIIQSVFVP